MSPKRPLTSSFSARLTLRFNGYIAYLWEERGREYSSSTDDSFETIVTAVEEGRRIFANIRKFVIFYLAGNVAEGVVLVLHFYPLKKKKKKIVCIVVWSMLYFLLFWMKRRTAPQVFGIAASLDPPLIPLQILWANLITGTPPGPLPSSI